MLLRVLRDLLAGELLDHQPWRGDPGPGLPDRGATREKPKRARDDNTWTDAAKRPMRKARFWAFTVWDALPDDVAMGIVRWVSPQ
ncbi:hypothetical protein ACFVP0_02910 [Streptomyces cinereoruber]|uniref:hypothetical protein n=1 Tax=Streptomyces cinereoruber TaxID=67260 RepID=UPI0036AEE5BE